MLLGIAALGFVLVPPTGGGSCQAPPGFYPFFFTPVMTAKLTQYPTDVKAGTVFHVKGSTTDLDSYEGPPPPNPNVQQFASLLSTLMEAPGSGVTSGKVFSINLTGEDSKTGQRDWDVTITALTDLGDQTFLLMTDSFIGRDTWIDREYTPNPLHDPDTDVYSHVVKVSVTGPPPPGG